MNALESLEPHIDDLLRLTGTGEPQSTQDRDIIMLSLCVVVGMVASETRLEGESDEYYK